MRTLLVDDEPLALERMRLLCDALPQLEVVGATSRGRTALALADALAPELILLDISMPDLDGIQVARLLAASGRRAAIIFCTAFADFAVSAFDVAAVDYLLKPISLERLGRAVSRVDVRLAEPGSPAPTRWADSFWISERERMVRILASDIDRIEAERDYMRLHVGPRSYLLHETITVLERRLDPALFLRIHRSSMVRRGRITGLKRTSELGWAVELAGGAEVKIGRTYLAAVRAALKRA